MKGEVKSRPLVIRVHEDTVRELVALKVHWRETYEDVIKRLIEFYKKHVDGETGCKRC